MRGKQSIKVGRNRWKKERARKSRATFRARSKRARGAFARTSSEPHTLRTNQFLVGTSLLDGVKWLPNSSSILDYHHICYLYLSDYRGLSSPKIVFCVANPSNKYVPKLFETAPDSSRDCWKDTWVTGQVPMHIKWPTTIPSYLIFEWCLAGVN